FDAEIPRIGGSQFFSQFGSGPFYFRFVRADDGVDVGSGGFCFRHSKATFIALVFSIHKLRRLSFRAEREISQSKRGLRRLKLCDQMALCEIPPVRLARS